MTDKELLNCLKDRPCKACKFREKDGCTQWDCVFDAVLRQEPKTDTWSIKEVADVLERHGWKVQEPYAPDINVGNKAESEDK